jgi:tRNA(Ile)-lysidine synthase
MIMLQGKLPRKLALACSGGPDSMAALSFLIKNHEVTVIHCDHGTPDSVLGRRVIQRWLSKPEVQRYPVSFVYSNIKRDFRKKHKRESKEEYWRKFRYDTFDQHSEYYNQPIITAHNLDDCVETWLWSSINGEGKLIPYRNNKVIRPFLLNKKRDLTMWCQLNGVEYHDDKSNTDLQYTRNYIRHELMPHVLKINPGIQKVVRKKLVRRWKEEQANEHQ